MVDFSIPPVIVAEAWNRLKLHKYEEEEWMRAARPEHLLWAVYYLKQYTTESKMADKCKRHEDMFCKWTAAILDCITGLEDEVVHT